MTQGCQKMIHNIKKAGQNRLFLHALQNYISRVAGGIEFAAEVWVSFRGAFISAPFPS
jgi:hypothetical protein